MLRIILSNARLTQSNTRCYTSAKPDTFQSNNSEFETVFSFPFIKYLSVVNRLKVYQLIGTSVVVPGCGLLETLNILSPGGFLSACYIGLSTTAVMSLATLPFRNIIGFIYISKDNERIKISYLDFWGKRRDKITAVDNWTPLLDMKPKLMDPFYLTPRLSDGTEYKLFIKFGNILNSTKMGQFLE